MLKKASTCFVLLTLLTTSCTSHLAVLEQGRNDSTIALHEMRSELADLKHALSNTQVELQILEEQVKAQDPYSKKGKIASSAPLSDSKLAFLEKRLSSIEQMQEKIHADLKQLSTHANQTSSCLTQYSNKISELEKNAQYQQKLVAEALDLKSSFKNLASSLKNEPGEVVYKVKAGDSLEKIAKIHKISLEALKKENDLTHSKILIGQELKIPHERG